MLNDQALKEPRSFCPVGKCVSQTSDWCHRGLTAGLGSRTCNYSCGGSDGKNVSEKSELKESISRSHNRWNGRHVPDLTISHLRRHRVGLTERRGVTKNLPKIGSLEHGYYTWVCDEYYPQHVHARSRNTSNQRCLADKMMQPATSLNPTVK